MTTRLVGSPSYYSQTAIRRMTKQLDITLISIFGLLVFHVLSDNSCMTPVQQCPLSQSEWMTRTAVFNCSLDLNYTCIFNTKDQLVETCTINYRIQSYYDGCPVVTSCRGMEAGVGNRKLYRECPHNVTGCPPIDHQLYTVYELFKYPACLVYNYSDLTTSTLPSTVHSGTTKATIIEDEGCAECVIPRLLIVIGTVLSQIPFVLVVLYYWRQSQGENRSHVPGEEEESSLTDGEQEGSRLIHGELESLALCEQCGATKQTLSGNLCFKNIFVCLNCDIMIINEEINKLIKKLEEHRQKSIVLHERGLEEAIKKLRDKRAVVITGRERCGKRSFSEDLMNKLLDHNIVEKVAQITSQKQWNVFLQVPGTKCAYLRNEAITLDHDWLTYSDDYNTEEIFLIIVHGMEIYNNEHFEENFESIINLSFAEFELSPDERKHAIIYECNRLELDIGDDIDAIVEMEPEEGFLNTLNLYLGSLDYEWKRRQGLKNFFDEVPKLQQASAIYLKEKDLLAFLLLSFCYLCAKDIDVSLLYQPLNKSSIHRFVNLDEHKCPSSQVNIVKKRQKLMRYNLRLSKKEVLAIYGDLFPQYYIDYSVNSEFFIEHTGSKTSTVEVFVEIPDNCAYRFVQRLVDMLGKKGCIDYLRHYDKRLIPFVTTEFPAEEEFPLVLDIEEI